MTTVQRWRWLALVLAVVLFAAACGDSDDDAVTDSGAETTEGDAASEGESGQEAGGVDEGAAEEAFSGDDEDDEMEEGDDSSTTEAIAEAGSIEELEEQWAARRAEIVQSIVDEGYGVGDDDVLRGPGGFELDLSTCPADWDPTEGIGDTIKIGHTTALSGNLAAYGDVAAGWEAYIDYVNEEHGGVGGLPMELIVKDDGYVAGQTIEQVDALLQSDRPFYIVTLGSPNTLATYDTLNDACVPQPFVMTGHPAWGDPVNHPWTTGLQMSYATEAILWGNWIRSNLADQLPVRVGGLVIDNDFGLAYEEGFAQYAEENPDVVSEFVVQKHDPAAPTVTNEITTLAGSDLDVFISMTAGEPCLQVIQDSATSGLKDSVQAVFTPSVCKGIEAFMAPAGDAADDWYIVGGGLKVNTDPQYADETYVSWMNDELDARGLDHTVDLFATGFGIFGWSNVEALRVAAELPGGLTRPNFILAVRSLQVDLPLALDGIATGFNGAEDAYFIEGSDIAQFDAADQAWIQEGDVIDLDGSSPNCAWDVDNGGCA